VERRARRERGRTAAALTPQAEDAR
jgi:hypothetical protein